MDHRVKPSRDDNKDARRENMPMRPTRTSLRLDRSIFVGAPRGAGRGASHHNAQGCPHLAIRAGNGILKTTRNPIMRLFGRGATRLLL